MEVNKLSYLIYKYLEERYWIYTGEYDDKFVYIAPPDNLGLPADFILRLPIQRNSIDFESYMDGIINAIKSYHPHNNKKFRKIVELNENWGRRFKDKESWIIPHSQSKIEPLNKFEPYFPIHRELWGLTTH